MPELQGSDPPISGNGNTPEPQSPARDASSLRPDAGCSDALPVSLWVPLALLALAAVALAIDCPLAQWFPHRHYPRLLAQLIDLSEVFGHGIGVAVLAIVIYQLDLGRRWAVPRVLLCSLGAGMTVNVVKMLIARTRPRFFDFEGEVAATFAGWMPLGRGGAALQSFPSGHMATAVGFAVALAWLYPRGRWIFGSLAVLAGCQRMQSSSHYLSDVLIGAAVGLFVARACIGPGRLATQLARLEARWKKPSTPASSDLLPLRRKGPESKSSQSDAA
jgi:membrane-associated phospholipid phosphatase